MGKVMVDAWVGKKGGGGRRAKSVSDVYEERRGLGDEMGRVAKQPKKQFSTQKNQISYDTFIFKGLLFLAKTGFTK